MESHDVKSTENPSYYYPSFPIGEGKTDYEKYLRTLELLSLQKTNDEAASPQELLFQVTHQTAELWMKVMLDELDKVLNHLPKDEIWMACRCFRLINGALGILIRQVDMLGENLSIVEYGHIRIALGQGSGMESPGFNRLLATPFPLWEAFSNLLTRRNVSLKDIYVDYTRHIDLHTLAELLMDFDDLFHKWRHHHFDLVARSIGTESNSLKGLSTQVLQKGVKYRFFPELLALRSQLTNESKLAYGGQPLEE